MYMFSLKKNFNFCFYSDIYGRIPFKLSIMAHYIFIRL